MRLLVLTNMYPPHHYGGYELSCQEAVEALRAAGHDVLVPFTDFLGKYVFHCHNLEHEDHNMMSQFEVVSP